MSKKADVFTWLDRFGVFLGRVAIWASRTLRLGQGGMIGGKIALKVSPHLLTHLAQGKRVALVTGTNGKTTTTRMLYRAVQTEMKVACNSGGDNMPAGIVSALMEFPHAPVAVLEVDEMHLPAVAAATKPVTIVLLNLSRDQLDRVGEIATIEGRIRQAVNENPQAKVVVNVDDPLMTSAAWDASQPIWVASGKGWRGDSLTCPRTGGAIVYSDFPRENTPQKNGTNNTNDRVGDSTEGLAGAAAESAKKISLRVSGNDTLAYWKSVPVKDLFLTGVAENHSETLPVFARPAPVWVWQSESFLPGDSFRAVNTTDETETEVVVNLPGRANRGNALQALVAAKTLGMETKSAARGISQVESVAGRYAQLDVKGRKVRMLLAKNPAGWMESLTMLNPGARLIIGVNGQRADGVDLSWLWDVDFEKLRGKTVIATGERSADLQVRLNYADVKTLAVSQVEEALEMVEPGEVDLLLNYTAFRDTRAGFVAKGLMR